MLRLPPFDYHRPSTLDSALELLSQLLKDAQSVKLLAGGTDLLPNMKHEVSTPDHLISLRDLGLSGVHLFEGECRIGTMTRLDEVAKHPAIHAHLPALGAACQQIAGPQLRRMATLGGNICLDTRCQYINQSYFWRSALGFCLKKDGDMCHVVAGGRRCVAAASNDSALPLLLYDTTLLLQGLEHQRLVPLRQFYVPNGTQNTCIQAGEILTEIRIPLPSPGVHCYFEKLRLRQSIDFALVNVAVLVAHDPDLRIERLVLAVGSLAAQPKLINLNMYHGQKMDGSMIQEIADKAVQMCHPLSNQAMDANWRNQMIGVLLKRALNRLM